jgi:GDP-L-fucose synthase
MKLLVTGSNGLVGNALRDLAGADTYFATREDGDLTDFEMTRALFARVEPTHVIHLAALVGGIGGNLMHSGKFFRDNILINTNVLDAAREVGVEKLVSFMSTCVFPNDATYPLTVDQLHLGPPHPSNFGYAYAKRMLEVQSRAYRAQWGMNYVVLIPTNIYGPHDNWNLMEGHVVPALIHKCYLAKQSGEPLVVWGSGTPLREFVYSRDIGALSLWAVSNYDSEVPLILTSGTEVSIRDLVGSVVEAMDFNGEVVFDADKPDGQFRKPSSAEPLHKLVPDFEFTSLRDGMDETVRWFVEHYPQVRM